MGMKARRPFFFIFFIISMVLLILIYLIYTNDIYSSVKGVKANIGFLNHRQPFAKTYCRLKTFSKHVKKHVYLKENTQASRQWKSYLLFRSRLRSRLKDDMKILNISNTSLDVLSAQTNILLSGKVRFSDYILLPDPNLEESMVRYIDHTSLQWILRINGKEIREFRQSDEYILRPFFGGKIGPEYTDLLKEKPFPFLEDIKNPCWMDERHGLLCLPYMYLIGFRKSGTTDVYEIIKTHPQFVPPRGKEPHWLSIVRFATAGAAGDLRIFLKDHYESMSSYISKNNNTNGKGKYSRSITGDFSTSTGYDNDYWRLLPENKNRTEPLHTNADYIRHLYPDAKIVAILRNPVNRLYSSYKYFHQWKLSPDNFHNNVVAAIDATYRCFRLHSIRRCAYDDRLHYGTPISLCAGMYYIYILDFHRSFPRKQIFVFTTANFSKNKLAVTKKLFRFLELEIPGATGRTGIHVLTENVQKECGAFYINPINKTVARKINKTRISNMGTKNIGPMLSETRKILNDFYRPFNRLLADLLNDSLFNFDLEDN